MKIAALSLSAGMPPTIGVTMVFNDDHLEAKAEAAKANHDAVVKAQEEAMLSAAVCL
jgi:hypothetical protein